MTQSSHDVRIYDYADRLREYFPHFMSQLETEDKRKIQGRNE